MDAVLFAGPQKRLAPQLKVHRECSWPALRKRLSRANSSGEKEAEECDGVSDVHSSDTAWDGPAREEPVKSAQHVRDVEIAVSVALPANKARGGSPPGGLPENDVETAVSRSLRGRKVQLRTIGRPVTGKKRRGVPCRCIDGQTFGEVVQVDRFSEEVVRVRPLPCCVENIRVTELVGLAEDHRSLVSRQPESASFKSERGAVGAPGH